MPTATIDKHPWTTNDLVPKCVLTHEVAKWFLPVIYLLGHWYETK